MRRSCIVLVLLCASAAVMASADACDDSYLLEGPSPSRFITTAQINAILKEHNDMRRTVRPYAAYMPMLKWDQNLANYAQNYINTCPGLVHSPSASRMDAGRFGYWYVGENMAAGLDMNGSENVNAGANAVKLWNHEKSYYAHAADSCFGGEECRHYTQVVWADTTHVGCGWASCPRLKYKYYWSCVYGVGGNIVGSQPYAAASLADSAVCTADRGPVTKLPGPPSVPEPSYDACDASYYVTSASSQQLSLDQINGILTEHNDARRAVYPFAKDMPMLQWDDTLAELAAEHLSTCPGLVHSPQELRTNESRTGFWYVGENMAAGPWLAGDEGGRAAVKQWIAEKQFFTYPNGCVPGKECWHYTQVIWSETTHVGCAMQMCPDPNGFYWLCAYGPGGNLVGEPPYAATTIAAESAPCSSIRGPVDELPPPAPLGGDLPDDACDASYLLTSAPPNATLPLESINGILRAHNSARRGVVPLAVEMPMLKWDQKLADFAQSKLETCPGLVVSSAKERQNRTQFGYWYVGENRIAGTDLVGISGGVNAVRSWVSESPDWTFPMTCAPGKECWHYTQVIWSETTHIGCATQTCPNDPLRNYWSCIYGVGGNFVSENPYTIAKSTTEAAYCSRAHGPRTTM